MKAEQRDGLVEMMLKGIDDVIADLGMTTDELGDFWLKMTEGATLRLVILKPEMVRRVNREEEL